MFSLNWLNTEYGRSNNTVVKYMDECDKAMNKRNRLLHIKKWIKDIDLKSGEVYVLPMTSLYQCKKFDIEWAILEIKMEEYRFEIKKLNKMRDEIFIINKNNSKYKKVNNFEKRCLERDCCGICFESHNLKQIVTTNCGHNIGKRCLSKLLRHNYFNDVEICCPYCRNNNLEFTRYYK